SLRVWWARPNLIAQQEIDDSSARFSEADAQLMTSKAALAASEEQMQAAVANRERIETMISYLRITAPFTGVITKRNGDPGAMIQAGTASQTQAMPVVRVSQVDHLRLVLPVPESMAARIRVGTPVEVRVDALNRVFQGKVSRYTGKLNGSTRTMDTEVDIPNPSYALMPGMYGYATLKLDFRNDALAVPVQAISGRGSSPSVLIVNSAKEIEERRVTLGIETPHLTEIKSGLQDGDLVVLGNRSQLRAGLKVEPKLIDPSDLRETN
ncbi:MAG: efflux RND transporter periplasmic adaptor subunit, partial [Chloroflexi bacterium]|nr:efflux RND transporter periplasmic adaptor subunit [Chloroflexota bacterium]